VLDTLTFTMKRLLCFGHSPHIHILNDLVCSRAAETLVPGVGWGKSFLPGKIPISFSR